MAASAAVIQALAIACASKHMSPVSQAVVCSRVCTSLRSPPSHTSALGLRHLSGTVERRHALLPVVEAAQAGEMPRGSGAATSVDSRSSGAVQELVSALDRRDLDAAWAEFVQLLEDGILPPAQLCDRLIYGEARLWPAAP